MKIEEEWLEFKEQFMRNSGQTEIDESREIWRAAEHFYKRQQQDLNELRSELLEFMGYDDEFLKTKPGYMKYKKEDLVEVIFRQRTMIRKLLNELDESTKNDYFDKLDNIYMNKAPLK